MFPATKVKQSNHFGKAKQFDCTLPWFPRAPKFDTTSFFAFLEPLAISAYLKVKLFDFIFRSAGYPSELLAAEIKQFDHF